MLKRTAMTVRRVSEPTCVETHDMCDNSKSLVRHRAVTERRPSPQESAANECACCSSQTMVCDPPSGLTSFEVFFLIFRSRLYKFPLLSARLFRTNVDDHGRSRMGTVNGTAHGPVQLCTERSCAVSSQRCAGEC